jgi:hypothetical protein
MRAAFIFAIVLAGAAAAGQTASKPVAPAAALNVSANTGTALSEPKPPKGKRDPFVSPLVKVDGTAMPTCTVGKKCLAVEQIELKGVVASQNGMIALVVNNANRAYFLRENDALFNGVVAQITRDSIVFRQNIYDTLGRLKGTRDIVRKVNAPIV